MTEAKNWLRKYSESGSRQCKAMLIPAVEDGCWLLMRVQLESRSIFVVDSRPDKVRHAFSIAKTLRKIMG